MSFVKKMKLIFLYDKFAFFIGRMLTCKGKAGQMIFISRQYSTKSDVFYLSLIYFLI